MIDLVKNAFIRGYFWRVQNTTKESSNLHRNFVYELCTENSKQHVVCKAAILGIFTRFCGGGYRNRTGLHGFAIELHLINQNIIN